MKKADIAAVIVIAALGIIIASVIVNAILGDPNDRSVTFTTIVPVTSDLLTPDTEIFNAEAINPTVEVYVGNCVDADANGELSSAELVACNRAAPLDEEEVEEVLTELEESEKD